MAGNDTFSLLAEVLSFVIPDEKIRQESQTREPLLAGNDTLGTDATNNRSFE